MPKVILLILGIFFVVVGLWETAYILGSGGSLASNPLGFVVAGILFIHMAESRKEKDDPS